MDEVGFIGAGHIGEPMVERLLAAGRRVVVYARRQEVRDRLAACGATIVETPVELAELPVVITCLFSDEHVLDLCTPIVRQMKPGSVFISHTTGGPAAIRTLSESGSANGVSVVEAPFSGTPEAVRAGRLTVLLAGDDAAVEAAAEVVQAYADSPQCTGGPGTALAAKLLNNVLFAACTQATLSALDVAESLGIEQKTMLDVLAVSSGGSTAAGYISGSGVGARIYSDRLLRYLRKDVASVRIVAGELGIDIADLVAAAERGPMDVAGR
ncbi:NAD(P)-dependent oxidoreductase [Gordonia insulae]|uniref:2-hydroxy-3-oxopropionate reductase n=1 Tax=Gordonia insulae TaxID=2420509 RepID=A0A3G8JLC0_9ACTN|nr:NAD(P)-binding domain-containing protein [Gordonia insulae]AZG45881.1 2-hydroxy-3-oxopropionate reductase [Gordonia insulae]